MQQTEKTKSLFLDVSTHCVLGKGWSEFTKFVKPGFLVFAGDQKHRKLRFYGKIRGFRMLERA